jgi:hypothetical protein
MSLCVIAFCINMLMIDIYMSYKANVDDAPSCWLLPEEEKNRKSANQTRKSK